MPPLKVWPFLATPVQHLAYQPIPLLVAEYTDDPVGSSPTALARAAGVECSERETGC